MAMTHAPRTTRGFTLVELMVTLAVLAILTMVAVPSFRDTIRRCWGTAKPAGRG